MLNYFVLSFLLGARQSALFVSPGLFVPLVTARQFASCLMLIILFHLKGLEILIHLFLDMFHLWVLNHFFPLVSVGYSDPLMVTKQLVPPVVVDYFVL